MPSPFPGMDPYLEAHWRDVHSSLVIYIRNALRGQLPAELRARVEERVVLETSEGIGEQRLPDARVVEFAARQPRPGPGTILAAATKPLILDMAGEPMTEGFLQIIDVSSGNRVVTIVEVISPTNKLPGKGREQYLRKQKELCNSDTNLVEIDLVRTGPHVAAIPLGQIPPAQRTPYLVCVHRATAPTKAEVYPIPLQERLPVVKVPLRPQDADVRLELQPLVESAYVDGGYEDGGLDYTRDPQPPLSDAAWAEQMLREKGLRAAPGRAQRRRKPPRSKR